MKMIHVNLASLTLVTAMCCAGAASAQYSYPGRPYQYYPAFPTYPAYPTYPTYPSFPVLQSGPQVTGWNPMTGGLNSGGTTLFNSAFDPWRQASMNNGSLQQVNQPLFDGNGNVIGWERGQQWYNPVTGQTHGDLQQITPNGAGGIHTQNLHRAAPLRRGIPQQHGAPGGFTQGPGGFGRIR